MSHPLVISYLPADIARIQNFLTKLLPYLDLAKITFVGGLAFRHHLSQTNVQIDRPFNDLDLVTPTLAAVSPQAVSSGDFLVSHFHDYARTNELTIPPRDRFYLVLVDPVNKVKIDIFDTEPFPPTRTIPVVFNDFSLNIISPEDQLCHLVWNAYGIINGQPIQAKMVPNIEALWPQVNITQASQIWSQYYSLTLDLETTWSRIQTSAKSHAELLKEKFFHRLPNSPCPSCLSDPSWPLTPLSEIYRLLGYVE
jgi:hypothetical protein